VPRVHPRFCEGTGVGMMEGCRQRFVPREKSWPGVTSGRTSGNVHTASLAAVCFWPASYLSLAGGAEEPQFPIYRVGGRAEVNLISLNGWFRVSVSQAPSLADATAQPPRPTASKRLRRTAARPMVLRDTALSESFLRISMISASVGMGSPGKLRRSGCMPGIVISAPS
jgi:hypothetical protein